MSEEKKPGRIWFKRRSKSYSEEEKARNRFKTAFDYCESSLKGNDPAMAWDFLERAAGEARTAKDEQLIRQVEEKRPEILKKCAEAKVKCGGEAKAAPTPR